MSPSASPNLSPARSHTARNQPPSRKHSCRLSSPFCTFTPQYGGSFNPITNAHLNCAAEIIHSKLADEVWIVPCGARPDK